MVKQIKRGDKTYFVCDCIKSYLVWIEGINNKKTCSNCGFRIEEDLGFMPYTEELQGRLIKE